MLNDINNLCTLQILLMHEKANSQNSLSLNDKWQNVTTIHTIDGLNCSAVLNSTQTGSCELNFFQK